MLATFLVVIIVSFALVAGAVLGARWTPSDRSEGFLLSIAGGALISSLMSELIEPASNRLALFDLSVAVLLGGMVFVVLNHEIDKRFSSSAGLGLLLAITLDGIPENLALGVALIGAEPMDVSALAVSILLSNLPEAAGGASGMREDGRSTKAILSIWTFTAAILSASAIAGNVALSGVADYWLSVIRCFAAGAVAASLAIEVFPKAFREGHDITGIGVTFGLLVAFLVGELG